MKFKYLKSMKKIEKSYSGGPVLVHGVYSAGKTHFAGSAIEYEKQYGEVLFANVRGEDGATSAMPLIDLPENSILEIDSWDAGMELARYTKDKKARLLVVDSLTELYETTIRRKTLGKRMPELGSGRGGENEWSTIHLWMEDVMDALRWAAHHVLFVTPSAPGVDLVKDMETMMKSKSKIYPDLRGKFKTECLKWFNIVGYLKADQKGEVIERQLHVAPSEKWATRQRLPNEIQLAITIPDGGGGWSNLMETIDQSYQFITKE